MLMCMLIRCEDKENSTPAVPAPVIPGQNAQQGECNDQILRLMQSLGIDQQKTMEVINSAKEKNIFFAVFMLN